MLSSCRHKKQYNFFLFLWVAIHQHVQYHAHKTSNRYIRYTWIPLASLIHRQPTQFDSFPVIQPRDIHIHFINILPKKKSLPLVSLLYLC